MKTIHDICHTVLAVVAALALAQAPITAYIFSIAGNSGAHITSLVFGGFGLVGLLGSMWIDSSHDAAVKVATVQAVPIR